MTNIEQSNEKRQRSQAITQTEWEQYMAEKILRLIRHELYMDFRYMDVALSALSYQPKEGIDTLGTEGDHLFYSADHLLRVYPCLLYTSPSPRDRTRSRMPSSA